MPKSCIEEPLQSQKDVPRHVAVIMDGNGRWAQNRGLKRLLGHREGYRTLKKVLFAASDMGIGCLTAYGFSAENWRRPEEEVGGLMTLIEEAARIELNDLKKNNVRCRVSGRLAEVPERTRAALNDMVEETRGNTGIVFNLAINYGGRAEVVDAVRRILTSQVKPDQVTEELISQNLYSPDLPEPDLMIRTAGEMRWSNFLLWQAAYAELYVTPVAWPEFDEAELAKAVAEYQRRTRKFGGL